MTLFGSVLVNYNLYSCNRKSSSFKNSRSPFILNLTLAKHTFFWGQIQSQHVEGENEHQAAKVSCSPQQVLLQNCNRLWKVRVWGWSMGTGSWSFFFFFSPLAHSFLILSVLLHTAFWVTVPFPEQFCNSRGFFQAVFGCPWLRCQSRKCTNSSLFSAFYKTVCLGGMKQCEEVWGTSPCAVPVLLVTSPSTTVFSHYVPSYTCAYILNTFLWIFGSKANFIISSVNPWKLSQSYNF